MDLVGYEFAKENGFTVHHYSADRSSVCYMDESGIALDIWTENGEMRGKLSGNYKMITFSTGTIQIPNKNFQVFYKQMNYVNAVLQY